MIVDASVALKWVVQEEGSEAAARLAGAELAAPGLLLVECANALWAKARRGELTAAEAGERIRTLTRAPVVLVPLRELVEAATDLALELGHPVYDCLYLALAVAREDILVTADQRFATAVRDQERYGQHIRTLGQVA